MAVSSGAVHPIERLRYVARSGGEPAGELAREAARALLSFAGDPQALVTACRRLVERAPGAGPMWWLAAHVLGSPDPGTAAWHAAERIDDDPTPRALAALMPDDATVAVVGWPEQAGEAFRRRGDLQVLVVDDGSGASSAFVRWLDRHDVEAAEVAGVALGGAAAHSTAVVLDAAALGSRGVLAAAGSYALAAVARHAGVPVWVVAGEGRVLPDRLLDAVLRRVDVDTPWEAATEVVPLDLVDAVIGPDGSQPVAAALRRADCPIAPELLGDWS